MGEAATRAARTVDGLYRSHAGEVYRYAYAMLGNKADAEDVTQTTFVNALRSLERGERPRKPSNWLVTIAHNIVRQRWRQQQARPAEVELDLDVALEEPEREGPSIDDLVRALQRIPHNQREALVMRELEGRSYKEIESILEISPSALEALLFRARRSLAEELENVVTCERAEFAMSKRLDGRLSRKDRRRLEEHIAECPDCAKLHAGRTKHRRAFGALSLLPLPFSFTFFRDAPSASAAAGGGLTTIGAGGVTAGGITAAAGVTATCMSNCVTGGLLASGFAVKAVAVVAAASVAGSVGYEGVKHVGKASHPASAVATQPSATPASPSLVAIAPTKAGGADRTTSPPSRVLPPTPSSPFALDVTTTNGASRLEVTTADPKLVVWGTQPAELTVSTSQQAPAASAPAPAPPPPAHPSTPSGQPAPHAADGSTAGTSPPAPVIVAIRVESPSAQETPVAPAAPASDSAPADPAAGATGPTDTAPPTGTTTAPGETTPPADTPPATTPPTDTPPASADTAPTATTPEDGAPPPDLPPIPADAG